MSFLPVGAAQPGNACSFRRNSGFRHFHKLTLRDFALGRMYRAPAVLIGATTHEELMLQMAPPLVFSSDDAKLHLATMNDALSLMPVPTWCSSRG